MIRNFVTGIVMGGVVAAVGLGVVSQLAPLPDAQVAANAPAKPEPAPVKVEAPAKTAEPVKPAVAPDDAAQLAEAAPEPAKPTGAAPQTPAEKPAVADSPTAPEAGATDPAAAAPQPKPVVDAPAAPAAPQTGTAPEVAAAAETVPAKPAAAALPQIEAADAAPAPADLPPADLPPATVAETDEALLEPAPPAKPAAPATITLDPAPEATPEPALPVAEPALPKVLETDPAETLQPSTELQKTVDGVKIGRLPSIAAPTAPAPTAPAPTEPAATDPAAPAPAAESSPPQDSRPLARFARSFQNDAGKPLFAVLLLDTGAADLDRAKLAALPFPVTFVIDPLDPAADAAEAIYRAAGQEVVMLAAGIPDGATAADLEQTFQANAAVLDQSVAVMDLGSSGFQDNRPLATQVVPLIKEQGRGLVTFDKGLNAADQVARRDGVAAAVIFRDLDAEGEDTPLIRRYLDRAAFKAAQEGRVVVLGTTRPETIAALMEWTLEGRASAVALAPVTAVLTVK